MNYKIKLISILFIASPVSLYAQKIYLGSCTTRDGGQYKGEMSGGKPNGKGTTIFKTGDTYEGSYLKGKRDGYVSILSPMAKSMRDNGRKTSRTDVAPIISKIIISM